MEICPYKHTVQYYETDRMGITHHSNYIRWMEEARVDFLEQAGWGYDKLEEAGIISPVTSVQCQYKESTTFRDEVEIFVAVKEFKGVRLVLEYNCLLYTSDAADDASRVDLGGRRIIKKKNFLIMPSAAKNARSASRK